jgi:uncharacterized membrane protein YeaQ/YmgE (transglycosylase-associated protein family)
VLIVLVFGLMFLAGWIAEEITGESEKWKPYRRIFLTIAIVGVVGEWLGNLAEYEFSSYLEAIDDAEISRLKSESLPRAVRFEQSSTLLDCLRKAPKGTVFVAYAGFNNEAKETHLAVLVVLQRAGFDARPQPLHTNLFVGFSGTGILLLTHDPPEAPLYAKAIKSCFGSDFRDVIGRINPTTAPWVGPNAVLIGVDTRP